MVQLNMIEYCCVYSEVGLGLDIRALAWQGDWRCGTSLCETNYEGRLCIEGESLLKIGCSAVPRWAWISDS